MTIGIQKLGIKYFAKFNGQEKRAKRDFVSRGSGNRNSWKSKACGDLLSDIVRNRFHGVVLLKAYFIFHVSLVGHVNGAEMTYKSFFVLREIPETFIIDPSFMLKLIKDLSSNCSCCSKMTGIEAVAAGLIPNRFSCKCVRDKDGISWRLFLLLNYQLSL
jgi:hypothetical protein